MFDLFARTIAFFYEYTNNYVLAIAALTVVVRLLLFPLTAKQFKSMQAMQQAQPEMKRLQALHKGDKTKLNEEMMRFYKERNINPLAGCLPLVLQMPLFFILFRVIDGLIKVDRHNSFGPKYLDPSSEMYRALKSSLSEPCRAALDAIPARAIETAAIPKNCAIKMVSWGVDLAQSASSRHTSFGKALPYFLLIAVVALTGWYQQRQMTARNPQASANPQAQMIGKVMPIFFAFISFTLPAGVVVYFVSTNLWSIGQQYLIYRSSPGAAGAIDVEAKPTPGRPPPPKPPKSAKRQGGSARANGAGSGRATPKGGPAKPRKRRR